MGKESFEYTYSATDEKELQKIKDKYRQKTTKETKMQQIVSLDKSVTKTATIVSIALGIAGSLILGVGMTCVTVWINYFAVGIVVGVVGLIIMGLTYPLYLKMVKSKKEQIAPQILKLTEEIERGVY